MTVKRTTAHVFTAISVLSVLAVAMLQGGSSQAQALDDVTAGVDLSSHQGDSSSSIVNFEVLASDRQNFAIVRSGSSEGCPQRTSIVQRSDDLYQSHVEQAQAVGLKIGHYWMNGTGNPVVDATYFVKHLANYTAGDPLVLDVEPHYQWIWDTKQEHFECKRGDFWGPSTVLAWVDTVRAQIPHANVYLYMNRRTLQRHDWTALAPLTRLWFAAYGDNSGVPAETPPTVRYWSTWSIWQYTNKGQIKSALANDNAVLDRNLARHDAWTPLQ